ncbi:MAG TPA: LLM class flavin-dependent oxidoreductase [Dehalococcoidia bacterium]|jgi:alkanesulfonate monooxygenase SsuD/methylene tetrahydromethanopterin reductase-like flavin-dependent oxidoreductase (luciferase family)
MRVDLLLVPFGTAYPELRAATLAAEAAGFGGVWIWDHLRVAPEGGAGTVPEALITLAGLAEATSRVQLGPLVLNVATRHPGLLANMAATLQQISGGRFVLGLGAGGSRETPYVREYEQLGLPVEENAVRAERVAEAVQVLRLLWSGGTQSFAGKHYQLHNARGFVQPRPAPPIVIAGFGPRMARLAGRYGDGFNTQAGHPELPRLIELARAAHAAGERSADPFEISAFAGVSERWLKPDSAERVRLEALGVDRIILLVQPPYPLTQIAEARRLLAST